MARGQRAAMVGSWVTITIVLPPRCSSSKRFEDFPPGRAVEVAGGLVGKEERRPRDERARDRDALALAAGQLVGAVVEPLAETDPLERAPGERRAFARAEPAIDERQRDVGERARAGEKLEVLEHEADSAIAERRERVVVQGRDVTAAKPIRPFRGDVEAAEEVHEG